MREKPGVFAFITLFFREFVNTVQYLSDLTNRFIEFVFFNSRFSLENIFNFHFENVMREKLNYDFLKNVCCY